MNGPVGARVAACQPRERLVDLLEEGGRQAAGRHRAERVAVEAGVLGGDPALLAADPHAHGAALALELAEHAPRRDRLEAARLRLVDGQVADRAQHVVEAVRVGGAGAVARRWRSASTSASAPGSISSRSSSWPSSSRSRSRSSESAAARRSAFGVSPSYM